MQEDTMKKPVSPALIAGVALAAVLILALIAYKTFGQSGSTAPTPDQAATMNKSSANQGEAYSQQIQSMPKPGRSHGSSYGSSYGQSGMGSSH